MFLYNLFAEKKHTHSSNISLRFYMRKKEPIEIKNVNSIDQFKGEAISSNGHSKCLNWASMSMRAESLNCTCNAFAIFFGSLNQFQEIDFQFVFE